MTSTTIDVDAEVPPRDSLVRVSQPFELIRAADGTGMPTLHGVGAVYDEWTEINSRFEGHFMERFAGGSFAKTIREGRDRIRCLFHHGQDPAIGVKPLGTITDLGERGRGVEYDVDLFDADYVRSLVPGLEAGVYGSSFRFGITRKDDERRRISNPKGLLERTVREATMRELGPTPFPAYAGTTAGVRSITDDFVLARFPSEELVAHAARTSAEPDLIGEIRALTARYALSEETDPDSLRQIVDLLDEITGTEENDPAPSTDAAATGTSERNAATPSTASIWGLGRGKEEPTLWHR